MTGYIHTATATEVSYSVSTTPTTDFAITFPFDDAEDLQVFVDGVAETLWSLVLGTQTDAFYTAGTVRLTTAVTSVTVLIRRSTQLEQELSLPASGPIPSKNVNREFARVWMALQDVTARLARAEDRITALE